MKIMILSQEEHLYLPSAIGMVCRDLRDNIECVVILPAMSTHGGTFKGIVRVARLFGLKGVSIMGFRVFKSRARDFIGRAGPDGPYHSVRSASKASGIPSYKVAKLNSSEFDAILGKHSPDLSISISCPQIVGKQIRFRFSLGCINVHSSPLPKYRGLMPAFWILRNGETETAVTVHDLDKKLDDEDILLQRTVPVTADDTWDSLVRKTKLAGAKLLIEAVGKIEAGTVKRMPNREEEGTYYSFPTAEDRKVFQANGRRFF